jgi:hypothetical protein
MSCPAFVKWIVAEAAGFWPGARTMGKGGASQVFKKKFKMGLARARNRW